MSCARFAFGVVPLGGRAVAQNRQRSGLPVPYAGARRHRGRIATGRSAAIRSSSAGSSITRRARPLLRRQGDDADRRLSSACRSTPTRRSSRTASSTSRSAASGCASTSAGAMASLPARRAADHHRSRWRAHPFRRCATRRRRGGDLGLIEPAQPPLAAAAPAVPSSEVPATVGTVRRQRAERDRSGRHGRALGPWPGAADVDRERSRDRAARMACGSSSTARAGTPTARPPRSRPIASNRSATTRLPGLSRQDGGERDESDLGRHGRSARAVRAALGTRGGVGTGDWF